MECYKYDIDLQKEEINDSLDCYFLTTRIDEEIKIFSETLTIN